VCLRNIGCLAERPAFCCCSLCFFSFFHVLPANRRNPGTEKSSATHRDFRSAHEGHKPHAGLDASRASTGVIWCTERANEHGFSEQPTEWANLGQGAPEADDDIVGSFPRPTTIPIDSAAREYGPTAGIKSLRAAVARLYNEQYRKGKESQYTWENVCIVPGGRAGLIRIAAILGNSYLSFPIPDYTAYSEMLSLFKNVRHPFFCFAFQKERKKKQKTDG
jgi:Aminotransferase class I and II